MDLTVFVIKSLTAACSICSGAYMGTQSKFVAPNEGSSTSCVADFEMLLRYQPHQPHVPF